MFIAVLMLVMASASASAKDLLIADVHFDDGSVLPNAKFKPSTYHSDEIKVKHENEFFTLNFTDLKILEFKVEPGTSKIDVCSSISPDCINIGKEAIVTLKIKTKTGLAVTDRFSTAEGRAIFPNNFNNNLCVARSFSFVSKLTGKEITKSYEITNLGLGSHKYGEEGCFFKKGETKAISSIVFKDGKKTTGKGSAQRTNVPSQGAAQKLSDLPEKANREQGQAYPNTRALQEAGAAFALGNYQEAIALFMPLAKQGNPLAQGGLGMMYYRGKGVTKNYKEAIKWYRKAAEQGYPLALFDLGVMYDKGHGVSQDYQMAIKWWTKAAEQNHLGAQYNLGLMYAKLMSVPDDLITAYKWANMAAASGHKESKKLLNMLRKNMTHAQIKKGQRLSEELIKKARSK